MLIMMKDLVDTCVIASVQLTSALTRPIVGGEEYPLQLPWHNIQYLWRGFNKYWKLDTNYIVPFF